MVIALRWRCLLAVHTPRNNDLRAVSHKEWFATASTWFTTEPFRWRCNSPRFYNCQTQRSPLYTCKWTYFRKCRIWKTPRYTHRLVITFQQACWCRVSLYFIQSCSVKKDKALSSHPIENFFSNSYILPSLDYCLTIWGNAPKTHIERLHKLQKCAARIILDAAPDAPSQPLFNDLNWLNIFERIQYNKGILMYKILNGLSPTYYSRSVSNRNLCIPRHSTESFKRTVQYSGAKLWNSLPLNIRTSKTIISFKRNFQNFIISNRNRLRWSL